MVSMSCCPTVISGSRLVSGVLEDHADPLAPDPPHDGRRQPVDPFTREFHPTANDPAGRLQETDHGSSGDRLAGARLTHHAQDLAGPDIEGHAVQGGEEGAVAGRELDPEIVNGQDRVAMGVAGRVGSSIAGGFGTGDDFTSASAGRLGDLKARELPVHSLELGRTLRKTFGRRRFGFARCRRFVWLGLLAGSPARSGCRPAFSSEPRVQRVAEPVAQEIHGEHENGKRDARKDGDPPFPGKQEIVADSDQRAERRGGRRDANAQEGQGGFRDDGERQVDGGDDEHRPLSRSAARVEP